MRHPFRAGLTGVVVAGLIAVPAAPAGPTAIRLTGVDSPLGGGPAFVMGGSTVPIPPQRYVDAADALYLQPHGFTGTVQGLFTPEALYPLTGPKSLLLDQSLAQGQQILGSTILAQTAAGHVDADNPAVIFGWSQSAAISSLLMPTLAAQGVPSDDVHFVMVGDPSAPNGGMLERFHVLVDGQSPTVPALGITFSGATPANLYPTDVYTTEYDGFADFPRYPINFLADLNAYLGILTQHTLYPALTAEQLASAIELPTSAADTMTNYYMIPAESLPLLVPLQLIPIIGQPLYDLLEPDLRILVNLGYGDIEHGWDPGPADVPTPFGLFPTGLDWGEVLSSLANGVPQGISAAVSDLLDPATYQLSSVLDSPLVTTVVDLAYLLGFTDATDVAQLDNLPALLELARNAIGDTSGFPVSDVSLFSSTPTEIINAITATVAADYATLLPIADTVNTLLTTVPSVLGSFVAQELADGNPLAAIGEPIAAGVGLIPFALIVGAGLPLLEAAAGTLINLADLVGLGG